MEKEARLALVGVPRTTPRLRATGLLLAALAQRTPGERALKGPLREMYRAFYESARYVARGVPQQFALPYYEDLVNNLATFLEPLLIDRAIQQAQRSYNDTVGQLRELGVEGVRRGDLPQDDRDEIARDVRALLRDRLEELPERLQRSHAKLGGGQSLAPLASGAANRMAKDIGTIADNLGRFSANREQGTGQWVWVTRGDERVRLSHRRLAGQRRRVGAQFSNGCRFPRDPLGPRDERENCRCYTRPSL